MPFPTTELLDSFLRTERPLAAPHWTKLSWVFDEGECFSPEFGWVPTATFGEGGSGVYWNHHEYTEPAILVDNKRWESQKFLEEGSQPNASISLWGCLNPTTHSGYRLELTPEETTNQWDFSLKKVVAGAASVLGSKTAVTVTETFGITVSGGKVKAWADEVVSFEAADATYTTGRVGIEGTEKAVFGAQNFRAGPPVGGPPEFTNPGTQHSYVGTPVSLQLEATNTTEYKATGLPEGLTLNEEIGLITGTPGKVETTKVKVKLKGPEGETSGEFEWIIGSSSTGKKNATYMIL